MPDYDGTGPMGQGVMPGGGFGFCTAGVGTGRRFLGFGRRRSVCKGVGIGRGFAFRRRVLPTDVYALEPKDK